MKKKRNFHPTRNIHLDRYENIPEFSFSLFASHLATLSGKSRCQCVTPRKLKSPNELDLVVPSRKHRDRVKLFSIVIFHVNVRRYSPSRVKRIPVQNFWGLMKGLKRACFAVIESFSVIAIAKIMRREDSLI